jgi:hypothetical protein
MCADKSRITLGVVPSNPTQLHAGCCPYFSAMVVMRLILRSGLPTPRLLRRRIVQFLRGGMDEHAGRLIRIIFKSVDRTAGRATAYPTAARSLASKLENLRDDTSLQGGEAFLSSLPWEGGLSTSDIHMGEFSGNSGSLAPWEKVERETVPEAHGLPLNSACN